MRNSSSLLSPVEAMTPRPRRSRLGRMACARPRECRTDGGDGLLPGRLGAAMADVRQASPVDPMKAEAPFVAHPPLVDVRVVARLQTHDARAVVQVRPVEHVVHVDVAALRAAVAHRRGAREIPDACLEAKILFGEGADRDRRQSRCRSTDCSAPDRDRVRARPCRPRLKMPNSPVFVISSVKRTQREQRMQRS